MKPSLLGFKGLIALSTILQEEKEIQRRKAYLRIEIDEWIWNNVMAQFIDQGIDLNWNLSGNWVEARALQQIATKFFRIKGFEISNHPGSWIEDLWGGLLWVEIFTYHLYIKLELTSQVSPRSCIYIVS